MPATKTRSDVRENHAQDLRHNVQSMSDLLETHPMNVGVMCLMDTHTLCNGFVSSKRCECRCNHRQLRLWPIEGERSDVQLKNGLNGGQRIKRHTPPPVR